MGTMRVLDKSGDIVVSWNPGDEDSTAQARGEFDRLQKDGYEFFNRPVGQKGRRRIKTFKQDAGEIIAAPGVATKKDKKEGTRAGAMRGGPNERPVMARRR